MIEVCILVLIREFPQRSERGKLDQLLFLSLVFTSQWKEPIYWQRKITSCYSNGFVPTPLTSLFYRRYVNQVIVSDMAGKRKWYFLCNCWLAVDLGEHERDRVFMPVSEKELFSFRYWWEMYSVGLCGSVFLHSSFCCSDGIIPIDLSWGLLILSSACSDLLWSLCFSTWDFLCGSFKK